MGCLSVFDLSQHLIPSFIIIYVFFFFHSSSLFFFFLLSLFFYSLLSLFSNMATREASVVSISYRTPSTYLPRHFRDCRLHQKDMSFKAYMELMGHIKETGIQWVVEWWHISSMVYRCCKDYCVPLVGLCCCSYYSTYRISRQFGECQGAPDDEGAFHTEVLTNRILGMISEV